MTSPRLEPPPPSNREQQAYVFVGHVAEQAPAHGRRLCHRRHTVFRSALNHIATYGVTPNSESCGGGCRLRDPRPGAILAREVMSQQYRVENEEPTSSGR